MNFVDRETELRALEEWERRSPTGIGLVWGRRRVGKTAILERFARERRAVFHVAVGRPALDELRVLSDETAAIAAPSVRDLRTRPFRDWDDALDTLAELAAREPLLLVLDEFPELVDVTPELPRVLRAFLDRARTRTKLRLLLCGSSLRTMEGMQAERAPLYGRLDLQLLVHPFRPHEASRMLRRVRSADRALVWGLLGGMPYYLAQWDQRGSVRENLARLFAEPGGILLNEGRLLLASDADTGPLAGPVLRAIAAGRTKYSEIADAVKAEPARTLDRLIELRLVDRVVPVTEDPRRTRRRIYRIADNFLSFWLSIVERHRTEIERGLGAGAVDVMLASLDDHLGPRWEEAFREHLRLLAAAGELGPGVVAVGPWWSSAGGDEIDAVVLAGRGREAILVGEAKWAHTVDAPEIAAGLRRKVSLLPERRDPVRLAICARIAVRRARDVLAVTASDIFP